MSSGLNMSKTAVKRIKQSELQLNSTIHKINSSLAESLHQIEHSVRQIEHEQGQQKGEYLPYYLRRRHSIEQIVESDTAFPLNNELRERASSVGSNPTATSKQQPLSNSASKESVSSEGSIGRRDLSPQRPPFRKSESTDTKLPSTLSQFYQFGQRRESRRNSLPMSFSLQNSHDFHGHSKDMYGKEGITVRLRRVEHELSQRKPKSRRQLITSSMTSIDERKEQERLEDEKRQQAVEEYVNSIEECNYLRTKTQTEISVMEVFQK
jgi:hypothetical protein